MEKEKKVIGMLLETHAAFLAHDLGMVVWQKDRERTSKFFRRERSLAYVLETLTGAMDDQFPSEAWCDEVLDLVLTLQVRPGSDEAKVSLERAEKRLRWALSNESWVKPATRACVSCGESYAGNDHHCTNRSSRVRDAMMASE